MAKIGYDNDKYLQTQSAHIRERLASFGGKLYLEFGGKLYDDYHAARVLPGFQQKIDALAQHHRHDQAGENVQHRMVDGKLHGKCTSMEIDGIIITRTGVQNKEEC